MKSGQLGLLLWKNYVVRKRQPGILGLVFLWPVAIFLILLTVRENVDPDYYPTCQFPSRRMPHDGLLPFVQNFVCTVGNPCEPLSEYEDVPSFGTSTLGPLMMRMQTILENDTRLDAVETLPKGIRLIKSMAEILTRPDIKKIFERGLRVGDIFKNRKDVKEFLRSRVPGLKDDLIDGVFDASVKLSSLIESVGSVNVEETVCSPEMLKRYLILEREEDLFKVSNALCNVDPKMLPGILEHASKQLDFVGLLKMVNRVMAKFRDYDLFQDLSKAADAILGMEVVQKYVPSYLRLHEWVPRVIPLFRNVTFKQIDLLFINKSLSVLDPIFANETDWPIAREGFLRMNTLLEMLKAILSNNNRSSDPEHSDLHGDDFNPFSWDPKRINEVAKILDAAYMVLQNGVKLTGKILTRHEDDIQISPDVLDALWDFFSQNIMSTGTHLIAMMQNVVLATHHIAMLHSESSHRIYRILQDHEDLVKRIFRDLDPEVFRVAVRSFSRLDFVERFLMSSRKSGPGKLFCKKETLDEVFRNFTGLRGQEVVVKDLFCSDEGKLFVGEIYDSFEFNNFRKIVESTLSTLISMAFRQPVPIERANVTSALKTIREFVSYLKTEPKDDPDWPIFQPPLKWTEAFEDSRSMGRSDLLGIHLTITKMVGSRSLSFITIKPDLENMDVLADSVLKDLRESPTNWINDIRFHLFEMLESFYLTVTDRPKTLKILEYSNFTDAYCTPTAPNLLNFPEGSDSRLLKRLVCRSANLALRKLELNTTQVKLEEEELKGAKDFNWTAFNEKIVVIYGYIDSLVQWKDPKFNSTALKMLKSDFVESWTQNVTLSESVEISVGLLCKLFDVMERPLFGIQLKPEWKTVYSLAWAADVVFRDVENVVDRILSKNGSADLSDILYDLPQTAILTEVLLRNLAPLTLDLVDAGTLMTPVHFISAISKYKEREPHWPCIHAESLGSVLEFRNGSRQVIREIERILCNPGLLLREWEEHPVLSKVNKIVHQDESVEISSFNWTAGYRKLRRFDGKMNLLLNQTIVLVDVPDLLNYTRKFLPEVRRIIRERTPKANRTIWTVMDYIDQEIDKSVEVFRSNKSASSIWNNRKRSPKDLDDVLVLGKFISHVAHESVALVSNILREDSEAINLFTLLGFTEGSSISIAYNRLAYILATFISGLSDPLFENRLSRSLANRRMPSISCSDIFSWFADFRIGITTEEYRTLKNFTCDGDPENFNAFTDLYIQEMTTWRKPTSSYRSHFFSTARDLHDVVKLAMKTVNKKVPIVQPFSRKYFEKTLYTLKNVLEARRNNGLMFKNLKTEPDLRNYRLTMEGLAEILSHVATALENAKVGNNELNSWQLVEESDVRQLLKLLEAHPEETITLMATIGRVNATNPNNATFRETRKELCQFRIEQRYWIQPNATHFLNEVCSYDPYQLLKSVTSDEFLDVILDRASTLKTNETLISSVTRLVTALLNLSQRHPGLVFRSNIVNGTTWRNLSNETWAVIRRTTKSWMNEIIVANRSSTGSSTPKTVNEVIGNVVLSLFEQNPMKPASRVLQILSHLVDLSSGGDVWQKLRTIYEGSRIKPLLNIVEDMPNLVITFVDTFINSDRLSDFVGKLMKGEATFCNLDKYLITPGFMRNKGLLSTISSFCQRIVLHPEPLIALDFFPVDLKSEVDHYAYNVTSKVGSNESVVLKLNETYLLEKLDRFQSSVIRASSEPFRKPKVPTWWTSFEEGTLKDFLKLYGSKDLHELSHTSVKRATAILKSVLDSYSKKCDWCSNVLLRAINSQLARHANYTRLLCDFNLFSFAQVQDTLARDFGWNETFDLLRKRDPEEGTLQDLVSAFEVTLHHLTDLLLDLFSPSGRVKSSSCFFTVANTTSFHRPKFYVALLLGGLEVLYKNVEMLDTTAHHEELTEMAKLAEKRVPIWKPLRDVVAKADQDLVDKLLPEASINVNMMMKDGHPTLCNSSEICRNSSVFYNFLSSKRAPRFVRYDPRASNFESVSKISETLARSLDLELIERMGPTWRQETNWDFTWLKELLKHLMNVLEESGSLLDTASKIDFENVSNILGIPEVGDGIINILRNKTVDKLFQGLTEILDNVEPFVKDPELMKSLRDMLGVVESMEIFKNLGLLDMKHTIKNVFNNWDSLMTYLVEKVNIPKEVAASLGEAKLDMLSVFLKERNVVGLKSTFCSPEELADIFSFENTTVTAEEISESLCQLDDSQTQDIMVAIIRNLDFGYLFDNLMSANVKNILANANLTKTEGDAIFKNMGVVSEILPLFKDNLPSVTASSRVADEDELEEYLSGKFLQDASGMICGRPLVTDSSTFYRVLSSIEDNMKNFDQRELESLPTDFCRETYKSVLRMSGGKIIWSYVKPLLRGRILYSPKTKVTEKVMNLANGTFAQMERLHVMLGGFEETLTSLGDLADMGENLKDLQEVMSSKVMKLAVKSLSKEDFNGDLSGLDLSEVAWRMRRSKKVIQMVKMLNELLDCVLVDRVKGFGTEEELEAEAGRLMDTNEFLAGVVFLDEGPGRSKRSLDDALPQDVTYKIRMDVDYVPSTARLKKQFWIPGPESSFVDDLRYLRGFVQLQDTIDRAIVKLKTGREAKWKTLNRQMPYPCWEDSSFVSTLYESQGVQVFFFFALMMCVGSAVKYIVWERESQNAMVMSVMGLKPWWNTLSWFITTMIEFSIVMVSIFTILIAGKILPRSDPFLVLILLLDYAFSTVTFCYMISTMFSSTSLAAVTAVVMFLLTYMPYVIVIAMEAAMGFGYKLLICLSMSTTFCYGCLFTVRKEVQGTGMQWNHLWAEPSPGDQMSLGLVLGLIALDGCIYALIGYLVARYTNSGKGFHWLRSRSLWWANTRVLHGRPSYFSIVNNLYFTNDALHPSATYQEKKMAMSSLFVKKMFSMQKSVFPAFRRQPLLSSCLWWFLCDPRSLFSCWSRDFEEDSFFSMSLASDRTAKWGDETDSSGLTMNEKEIGVRFEAVRKVFKTDQGESVAVDDFSLKLCEGEVTSLLGRNGAGKTTIIKMLTGMLSPTCGEIYLNGEAGSKPKIGVCPQDNVLVNNLTPREHTLFYARLKKPEETNEQEILKDVNSMLSSMELGRQEREPVSRLSGGTKRRLCVALAFLGSPKLVILDEPGAGVDPAARRKIWRLIDQHRQGRTVLLSTHHLDEADMLSDTVVIMHRGKILCSGSPTMLKTTYGQGYKLIINFPLHDPRGTIDGKSIEGVHSLLQGVVPNIRTGDVSGSEVVVSLPFQGKNGIRNDIAKATRVLEENQKLLGFSHYTLECDSLEKVFLNMCSRADSGLPYSRPEHGSVQSVRSIGLSLPADQLDLIVEDTPAEPFVLKQGFALLKKRLWHFYRDWRSPLAALILPTVFVAVAMGFSLIRPPSQDDPPLALSPTLYDTHPTYFYSIDNGSDPFLKHISLQLYDRFGDDYAGAWQLHPNDTGTCECFEGRQVCHGLSQPLEGLLQTLPGRPTAEWIVSTHQEYMERRYGGWSLSHMDEEPLFMVWYNNKGHHSLPAYLNALNEAIFRASGGQGRLTVINHPLKLSSDQLNRTTLLQHVADVGVALVLLIAFSLVGAQGARELVRERLSEEKRILYLAGVHPVTYWTVAFIWDFLVFGCSIFLAVVVFEIFELPAYVARQNLAAVCLLLVLFAWAMIPFTHLAEKLFDDATLSNMVLFCVNTFVGVASLATILVIDILGKSEASRCTRNILHHLLLFFPQYALGDGLVRMVKNDITAELLKRFNMDTYQSPLGWELMGLHYVLLALVGVVLNLANLAIECRLFPRWTLKTGSISYANLEKEEEDVAKERARVERGMDDDVLRTLRLRKEYSSVYGINVAVRNLSLGVRTGQCFGLLGVNGAGKSTTFKMLTTELRPTSGRIFLRGRDVGDGPLCSGEVGYCPQSDALDGFLSPHQCLTIHGEVCGLSDVAKAVETALVRFDLLKYAHQRVHSLSGGNRRKLCVAISVMAPSYIVLMDEPTSGMDPASKSLVARAVHQVTKNQGSVVMTSHSVADCESLCSKVGILARAGLRCIGSPQYLKHKYGEGHIAFLRFRTPMDPSELKKVISRYLPRAGIFSSQALTVRLLVPKSQDSTVSEIFAAVEGLAEELKAVDYTLTQSSLDQVLVNFSEEAEDESVEVDVFGQGRRTSFPNMYTSRDTIHMETF
ncbi:uncharacterized protein LOC105698871 [Orussus abietinus]|uniref:uncharacterized protein LOC105698871 n=1 Tax=Orussus abietinus TaxID=222816 RepID=UPI000C7161FE|nr:uncharacterized protein LOC105698871 [Orussus abietinus]